MDEWTCPKHPDGRRLKSGRCNRCKSEYNKEYRAKRIAAKDPAWYEYRRRTINNYTRRLRDKAHELLGAKCVCCGITRRVFLSIDHINNDGNEHRKTHVNQQMVYRSIIEDPDRLSKYQILCHNCNMAKAIEKDHKCQD